MLHLQPRTQAAAPCIQVSPVHPGGEGLRGARDPAARGRAGARTLHALLVEAAPNMAAAAAAAGWRAPEARSAAGAAAGAALCVGRRGGGLGGGVCGRGRARGAGTPGARPWNLSALHPLAAWPSWVAGGGRNPRTNARSPGLAAALHACRTGHRPQRFTRSAPHQMGRACPPVAPAPAPAPPAPAPAPPAPPARLPASAA